MARCRYVSVITVLVALVSGAQAAPSVLERCDEMWFEQRLDHFRWYPHGSGGGGDGGGGASGWLGRGGAAPGAAAVRGDAPPPPATWRQRYFVCDDAWKGPGSPIFFYAGNEGPVEGYIKSGGLLWENAARFGALLLWAEHRYYGASQPFGPDSWKADPSYLTSRQAMADYARLLTNLTAEWQAKESPIIAFGGSYGGMLAAWMRRHYPHIIAGAVAASAPVGQFPGSPGFVPSKFWEVVTRGAGPAGGAPEDCAPNVKAAFQALLALGGDDAGRERLKGAFRLCNPLENATTLAYWVQGAFDAFAMGSYPFPSSYMGGTDDHPLPAWPLRAACAHLSGPAGSQWDADALLTGLAGAAAVLYNATGDKRCFDLDLEGPAAGNAGPWDYQVCTEFMGQELPYFPATGTTDMFWDQGPFDLAQITAHCLEAWGVAPEVDSHIVEDGGLDWRGVTNVVFSNGRLDPWSAFGVPAGAEGLDPSVVVVDIEDGGHHVDLMFSTPADSDSIRNARATILENVGKWVGQGPEPSGGAKAAPRRLMKGPSRL